MTAHISKPVVVLPANKVATEEILADVRERHPNHPRPDAITRVITGCGVSERYFTRPFTEVVGTTGIEARNRFAFADAAKMAVDAARRALEATGLRADEVDGLVTSHTTSFAVPNLDVRLVEELGLRPDVARFPITTLGCAGGGQALVRATDLVRSRPGAAVLVVVAEALSTVYHRDEDTIESMIYKALFGDSAGACVVTGEPRSAGSRSRKRSSSCCRTPPTATGASSTAADCTSSPPRRPSRLPPMRCQVCWRGSATGARRSA